MILVEETKIATADLPVTTFKAHLRLGSGFSDDMLQDPVLEGCLRSALAAIESRTGKALMERRFSVTANMWTPGAEQSLPIAPVTGLHALTTTDSSGTVTPRNIQFFLVTRCSSAESRGSERLLADNCRSRFGKAHLHRRLCRTVSGSAR